MDSELQRLRDGWEARRRNRAASAGESADGAAAAASSSSPFSSSRPGASLSLPFSSKDPLSDCGLTLRGVVDALRRVHGDADVDGEGEGGSEGIVGTEQMMVDAAREALRVDSTSCLEALGNPRNDRLITHAVKRLTQAECFDLLELIGSRLQQENTPLICGLFAWTRDIIRLHKKDAASDPGVIRALKAISAAARQRTRLQGTLRKLLVRLMNAKFLEEVTTGLHGKGAGRRLRPKEKDKQAQSSRLPNGPGAPAGMESEEEDEEDEEEEEEEEDEEDEEEKAGDDDSDSDEVEEDEEDEDEDI
uniref:Small-subunit processome Utp12 domain-containing protein n=1 Tax=Chromera velia CCMP2878 TaxID=1169474 RepID=A0A0G4I986_9ALVE|mmetsp:Transcript_32970/g.65275  ORF Transcript_32970/g.65275 Transcript_32970/m.65275 type:complete len:305 (+) Transcript_32970:365-1279(+)|eukprot:Cvel_12206.t1-p1 / transcript=Cvel_12206.t1 / gene=Cvel_12206 / organism=Chromera_velia_CCMP2878 / gene_product=hypothetical protein / transcript_product=hypothetical protein / location=Cvel_scaffold789:35413-38767(+) / protein_length=304 / sequence_SO=supercontig / SO=protein_coding / is_pseudo=false